MLNCTPSLKYRILFALLSGRWLFQNRQIYDTLMAQGDQHLAFYTNFLSLFRMVALERSAPQRET